MRAMTIVSKSLYAFASMIGATVSTLTEALNKARAQSARFSGAHW